MQSVQNPDVLIVGGGLAGLACARQLIAAGRSVCIFEASDDIGGRVRTDRIDGFLLDRGFQVLLTAYPEAQKCFDYDALSLGTFEPGALVRINGKFERVADPWRRPGQALSTLFSSIGSFEDKMRVAQLRKQVTAGSVADIFASKETSSIDFLRAYGFSHSMIAGFFEPFFGGIFLERQLSTSDHMLQFVFRMFSDGYAALPAEGMGALPRQLAAGLPPQTIRTGAKVARIIKGGVTLESGEKFFAKATVLATDFSSATTLVPSIPEIRPKGTTCFYFAADRAPVDEPILLLNGTSQGMINSVCVPSLISRSYAPGASHLISVSVVDQDARANVGKIMEELGEWFGPDTQAWKPLKSYWIPYALPEQTRVPDPNTQLREDGIYVCGDYRSTASINGALLSGRLTAEAICAEVN